jgi:formylglycine-generating enzyme required for sulfatase activity
VSFWQCRSDDSEPSSSEVNDRTKFVVVSATLFAGCQPSALPTTQAPVENGSSEIEDTGRVAHRRAAATLGGMVWIPAGTLSMGSPPGEGGDDEHPQHSVSVGAFAMDLTEVTVSAYRACVSAGHCKPAGASSTLNDCNWGAADRSTHPINCVDWYQAAAYCTWLGKRLPTEEEWEYAARGTDGRTYPWGNDEPSSQLCWRRKTNQFGTSLGTCAAASFSGGDAPFGLHDMAGNVSEWTSSRYFEDRGEVPYIVARGGSWESADAADIRSAHRRALVWSQAGTTIGFRCAGDGSR